MSAISFPQNPNIGEIFTNPNTGSQFQWTGSAWSSYSAPLGISATGPSGSSGTSGFDGVTGPQGIQGEVGPVGPAGLNWRGMWSATGDYLEDDSVGYTGASWFNILGLSGSASNLPPDQDPTHWALLASQGSPGQQGPQGLAGTNGTSGSSGSSGSSGLSGVNGTSGSSGSSGFRGVTGATGSNGLDGATGATGVTGELLGFRTRIDKVSNIGIAGRVILAEGKVYISRGSRGYSFQPNGASSGVTFDYSNGHANAYEVNFPNETGVAIDADIYGVSAYALFDNGNLYTWGANNYGQLGVGNTTNNAIPQLASSGVSYVYPQVATCGSNAEYGRLFIRKTDGKVYGCGWNGQGALGLGNYTSAISTFTEISGIGSNPLGVWSIGGYDGFTFAQLANGDIVATGASGSGVLGNGANNNYNTWILVNAWKNGMPNARIQKVRGAARYHDGSGYKYYANVSIWVKDGSTSYIMFSGSNNWGNAGVGNFTNRNTPIAANIGTTNILDFERSGSTPGTCYVLKSDGGLMTWGWNAQGQCGDGTTTGRTTPGQFLTDVTQLIGGDQVWLEYNYTTPSIIAKRSDGTYWRSGASGYSQLGDGYNVDRTSFVQLRLPAGTVIKHFSCSSNTGDITNYLAITDDDRWLAWGGNVNDDIVESKGGSNIGAPIEVYPNVLIKYGSTIGSSGTSGISGSSGTSGTAMAYANFTFNTFPTSPNDFTPIIGNADGITLSGNVITLQNVGIYMLQANLTVRSVYAVYEWVTTSNIKFPGTSPGVSISATSGDTATPAPAAGIINVTVPNTQIKLRLAVVSSATNNFQGYSSAQIIQLR